MGNDGPGAATGPDGGWEAHAEWWIAQFTDGTDPEYVEQILPLAEAELAGAAHVLDVGCGEGQVARAVAGAGGRVTGVDPTWRQLRTATRRGDGPRYVRADAGALPVRDGTIDAVVACLVFEHLDDVDTAMAEIARVLEPGGRFCLFLNHPLLQAPGSGWIDDHTVVPPERYWRLGPYLVETETAEQVERGVWIRFVHRPLSRYVNTAADHGLVLERMLEPAPPDGYLARIGDDALRAYPRLLYLRFRARPSPHGGPADARPAHR